MLIHSPKGHSAQGWTNQKQEVWNSIQVSHVSSRDSSIKPSSTVFKGTLLRTRQEAQQSGLELVCIKDAGIAGSSLTCRVTTPAPALFSFIVIF